MKHLKHCDTMWNVIKHHKPLVKHHEPLVKHCELVKHHKTLAKRCDNIGARCERCGDIGARAEFLPFWQYRSVVSGNISDCGVSITPRMCNRVTNRGDMGTFFKPTDLHECIMELLILLKLALFQNRRFTTIIRNHAIFNSNLYFFTKQNTNAELIYLNYAGKLLRIFLHSQHHRHVSWFWIPDDAGKLATSPPPALRRFHGVSQCFKSVSWCFTSGAWCFTCVSWCLTMFYV